MNELMHISTVTRERKMVRVLSQVCSIIMYVYWLQEMVPLNSLMLQSVQVEVNEINLINKRNRIPHTLTQQLLF